MIGTDANSGVQSGADAAPAAATPAATPEPVPPPAPADPLSGTWWALSERVPTRAFRINLEPAEVPDAVRQGQWVSFDWRSTREGEALARRSKPVAITAHFRGEDYVLSGAAPMLDDQGQPNGHSGTWELVLQRAHLPGETPRFAGLGFHPQFAPRPGGAAFVLEREFRRLSVGD
ncbi:MAG: hypothetical protein ACT4PU_03380 [Planctomycetota bacterium]